MTAVSAFIDIGLFPILSKDGGRPKKTSDLADKLGVDAGVLSRWNRASHCL
jgi:hypothetical protein